MKNRRISRRTVAKFHIQTWTIFACLRASSGEVRVYHGAIAQKKARWRRKGKEGTIFSQIVSMPEVRFEETNFRLFCLHFLRQEKKREKRNERGNATIFQARDDWWKKLCRVGYVGCVCVFFSSRTVIEIFHTSVQVSQSLTELIVHRFVAEELPNPARALQVLFLRSINQDRSLSWILSHILCWKAQIYMLKSNAEKNEWLQDSNWIIFCS